MLLLLLLQVVWYELPSFYVFRIANARPVSPIQQQHIGTLLELLLPQVVWYELPSFYVFHIANAWEEAGKVKMVACQAERVDLNAMNFNEDMGESLV